MTARPIIMTAESVRDILEGRKTVTRRIVNPRIPKWYVIDGYSPEGVRCSRPTGSTGERLIGCPYGAPGDHLWVREAWTAIDERGCAVPRTTSHVDPNCGDQLIYRADDRYITEQWRSPLFMPRWASRITLVVTSVRVERLQEITEEDARREGIVATFFDGPGGTNLLFGDDLGHTTARCAFADRWDRINRKRSPWASSPWVWVISFRRVEP